MNCKRAKKLYLEFWELSNERQKELASHGERCAECGEEFQKLENVLNTCRQYTRVEQTEEQWSGYWHRLSRRLVKPSWRDSVSQTFSNISTLLNRFTWGPVPAYAVIAAVLVLAVVIFPVNKSTHKKYAATPQLQNNLVQIHAEPVSTTSQGSLTVYAVASR